MVPTAVIGGGGTNESAIVFRSRKRFAICPQILRPLVADMQVGHPLRLLWVAAILLGD